MSEAVLKEIVQKAMSDAKFRKELFQNPSQALAGYDLTDDERETLSALDEDSFETFAGNLGGRATKGWLPPTGG